MFVYYFVHVEKPFEAVVRDLTDAPGRLTAWGRVAYEGWDELRTRIHPSFPALTKEVEVTVGKLRQRGGATTVPISWKATGIGALFPVLEADLVVERIGADLTQITLQGRYRPPFGAVGRLLDAALFHRLAEACVKDFLNRLAEAVGAPGDDDSGEALSMSSKV
ncbi:MAG TPA: hypothetical protein VJ796_04650 [Acidimicrobiia bacterium]|nr:hypothetical protein [Acidimicrobiia bacterium]